VSCTGNDEFHGARKKAMNETTSIIWALVTLFGLAIVGFTVVGGIAFHRSGSGQAKSFGLLFQRGNFLRLGTVVLVVLAVLVLALMDKLTEGAAAVLSGVAGYVLGGLERLHVPPESRGAENDG
jgi:hypothetical protein